MANHISHAALPYPVRGCRFTLPIPYLDADRTPTDPVTPDTELSQDGGAYADCTEEVTVIAGANGSAYLTLTGDELNAALVFLAAKVASGPKATLRTLAPQIRAILRAATATGGAAGSITLDADASQIDDYYNGCLIRTTGGTGGGGGLGSRDNQARLITDYLGATRVAVVSPNWEVTPDATTTFEVLQSEWAGHVLGTAIHQAHLPSQIDIANMGLVKLGDKQLLTFDDDTDHARVVRLTYDRIVDAVLRAHRWRFATRQATLALLAGTPTWRYTYRFQLPTDPFCLKVTRCSADTYTSPTPNQTVPVWELQGRELLANDSTVTIEYVARITDPAQWDSLFTEAVVERLAMEWAIPITQLPALRTQGFQAYQLKLAEARAHDGFEGTPEVVDDTLLLDGR